MNCYIILNIYVNECNIFIIPRYIYKRNTIHAYTKSLETNVFNTIIQNTKNRNNTNAHQLMNKQNVACPHNGTLLNNKTRNNMN